MHRPSKLSRIVQSNGGFTLLEVLIASVILFMFIAMAAQIFRQSALSSVKAERAVQVTAVVPVLVETIRHNIREAKSGRDLSGGGELNGLNYRYTATLTQRKPPIAGFDMNTNEFRRFPDKFNLWDVDLYVRIDGYERHWIYEEFSWHDD